MQHLYAFTLGREWKLSLAELFALFGEESYHSHSESIALFHIEEDEKSLIAKFRNIWGSVRMIRIVGETDEGRFPTDVIATIGKPDWKYTFAIGSYGVEYRSSDIGLRIKKTLSEKWISARLVNTENKNINAATWKKEKLGKSQSEYNLIQIWEKNYIGITLACQDIDAYARRDLGKSRDMIVGMMPPKLVQMMVNVASSGNYSGALYDPFCWLGTTLIEWANMWYTSLLGSDLSKEMVTATEKALEGYIAEEKLWQDRIRKAGGTPARDIEKLKYRVWQMDASRISECKELIEHSFIVSEGYLGEIMSARDISLDRVKSERAKLAKMYDGFFSGLEKLQFEWNIVMSFPFWNIHDTYSYFSEIYDIIEKYGFRVIPLLPSEMKLNTMKWSLLYRRESQTVGREIIKIVPKM
jgi:tRNA G10  N-methylase Trm11